MRNAILIAIGAGLVSAIAFVSAMVGAPFIGFFLFLIAALPLYLAGLGWTYAAALLAASVGALCLGVIGAREAGMVYAGMFGLPAVLLTYLAGQHWPSTDPAGQTRTAWSSPGLLVVVSALIASAIAVTLMVLVHDRLDEVRTEVGKLIETAPQLSGAQKLTPEEIARVTEIVMFLMPAAAAFVSMAASLLNLWLAARVVNAAGQLQQPWPDLAAITYPRGTPLILAAATLASSTLTGVASTAAAGVSGAFFIAYLLMGLAVIHYVTRGKPWRPFALWAVYAGLLLINVWMAIPIIILGLLEAIYPMRRPPPAKPGNGAI